MNSPMKRGLNAPLVGTGMTLTPLDRSHRKDLLQAAADGELWNLTTTNVPGPETVDGYIEAALSGRDGGTVIPYVLQVGPQIVGASRFWKYDWQNRKVEIGHTWIASRWQRTFVNTEAKLLMLSYAFEVLDCVRVQFTTDVMNERSRAAVLRLGAVQEGIVRHERIMPDGRKRDSVRFSIIDTEWIGVKERLRVRLLENGR